MSSIPSAKRIDSTLALLRNPYGFIPDTCSDLESDLFETRILFQKTICTNVNVRLPTLHPALIPLIWSPPLSLIAILKHLQRTSTTPLHQ